MQLPDQMYINYVMRRLEDYEQLKIAFQNDDVTYFKKIGHQLKGNASSFGFDDLVILGNKMNDMTPEKLKNTGTSILEELKNWITDKKNKLKIP